ncbi:hypothetical protein SRHO_G00008000 [Serrasalmus rhombeus]
MHLPPSTLPLFQVLSSPRALGTAGPEVAKEFLQSETSNPKRDASDSWDGRRGMVLVFEAIWLDGLFSVHRVESGGGGVGRLAVRVKGGGYGAVEVEEWAGMEETLNPRGSGGFGEDLPLAPPKRRPLKVNV